MALYRCPTAISATEGASPLEGFCASLCPELPATRAASASALMSLLVRILFSLLFVTWRFPSLPASPRHDRLAPAHAPGLRLLSGFSAITSRPFSRRKRPLERQHWRRQ